MKYSFKSFPFLLLIFVYSHSFSQSNWQKGFYVGKSLDTIQGFIDHKEWVRNPSYFSFKKSLDQNERTLRLNEVSYFEVTDWVAYKKYFVPISMNDVKLGASENQHPSREDTVFLKLVQTGRTASLYSYKDDLKERYYLQGPDDKSPYELIYAVETNADGNSRVVEKFKGQLYSLAAKAGKINTAFDWSLRNASYGVKSLTEIVNKINGGRGTQGIMNKAGQGKTNHVKNGLNFYFGTGVSRSDLVYSGGLTWAKGSSPSYNPYAVIGVSYFTNPGVRRIFINAELSLVSASFHTVANNLQSTIPQRVDYTFNQLTKGLSLSVNYNFYNTPQLSCFVGAGVRASFCSYSNNVYTITETYPGSITTSSTPDFFSLSSKYTTPSIKIGALIRNRIEGVFEYNTGVQINEAAPLWKEKIVSTRLGINYWIHHRP